MPITTRSQFKLRKRSPPPEVVSQPPKRKSKRVAKEEPDEQFQAELEKVYVGEKRGAKTLREKIGYDEPEEDDDDESSEDEDGEDSAEDDEEAVDDGDADDVGSESSSDAENAGDDSDDAGSEDEEADDAVLDALDAENPGIDVNDSDDAVSESSGDYLMASGAEEEDDEPKIQELNEEFFNDLESSVQFLKKGPKQKAANIERLGECITRLDTQFVCFLRSREILTPSEEKKCQDDVKLRLLKNYKELLELLPALVNDEKVELIVRQRTAIALNNFAKEERPGRALQAAVKAYLSSSERHCAYIEDLGSALQDDHRRAGVAAREALQVVEEVTANGQQASDIFVTNLLSLLSSLTPPEIKAVKYKSGSFEAVVNKIYTQIISGVHAKKGAETEYGVKPLPLNDYNARRLLIRLPTKVFPLLKTPTMAADLLDRYFARGGIFTFLALEGIFTLMTKHNLEFPHFYQKLYASLNASILTSGYRNVYFRMMDRFFSSTHLPDYLVRAFVKKLSRLALGAPADAAFGLIPMILNFVIRYPSLKSLVTAECAIDKPEDPFDVNEPDPSKCKAQNSCLWELKCLTQHAVPDVAEMAVKTLKQPMPTMESDVSKRIDTNMEYVFRTVSNKVVPPDVALAIRPDVDFLKLGFV